MNGGLTVLMTVYNGSPYLRTAIDSILEQTYCDFQFLIVDDASTDDTREIIRSYEDSRIQLLCLEQNVGQTVALNIGLRQASTQWIARMDADDYSAPSRFEEQMRALDEDSSLACVGSFGWIFRDDPQAVERIVTTPTDSHDIKQASLAELALIHGCIIVSTTAKAQVAVELLMKTSISLPTGC
jgi:glycosyltransferase involved in cell wall biosynthesis